MAFCEQCGAPQDPGTKFCAKCGNPVGLGLPEPPTTTQPHSPQVRGVSSGEALRSGPENARDRPDGSPRPSPTLPTWCSADWPLVGLCVLLMLGALFVSCAMYGAVMTVVASGGADALVEGATTGLYLVFTAFGVNTAVTSGAELPSVFLALQFFPLPLGALGGAATWLALRFAGTRLADDRSTMLAFAGKLALTFGIVMGVLASVLSIGDPDGGDGFTAEVSGGEAWIYSTLIVALAALIFLHLRGVRLLPERMRAPGGQLVPYAIDGAKAFGLLALGMTPVVFVAAMIAVDSGSERLGVLFGALAVGLTMGVTGAALAMGGAIELIEGHVSLLKFGFPPGVDAGAAPLPVFLLVLIAPAVVAWLVQRRLESEKPGTEQDAIKIGFAVAIAFALTAWFAVLLNRVALSAFIRDEAGDVVAAFVFARPSPGAVFGLALVSGLVGGLGMAFVWARQQGAGWRVAGQAFQGSDQARPTPVDAPDQPSNTWTRGESAVHIPCPSCGIGAPPGARFCPGCGEPVANES